MYCSSAVVWFGLISLLPLARNLVWLTAGPFGAPFRRGRSSRFGQIWKRSPDCQGALRWRCQRMTRGNSSPINGENQRSWKHLSKIFLQRRRSRYAFSQTPLTPTWEKSGKMTPPPENFSARGSSSSFSPFTLKCPNSSFLETTAGNFLKYLLTSISSHRSPQRIMPASPPVSGRILPATLLCKNRDKVAPPPENFSARESSSNVQNRAFWKPLPEIFLKYLFTSISSHRSTQRIIPASPPVSDSILSAAPLCKKSGQSGNPF